MKNLMKTAALAIASLVMVTITSCSKKGDTGPKGDAGKNGNANVISTNNVTLTSSNWTQNGNDWNTTLSAPGITQDIVDKGVVEVYIKYGNGWVPLPDISGINSTVFELLSGSIDLINSNSDNSLPSIPGTETYRVVIISASAMAKHPNIDYKNYNQVKEAFNLGN